MSGVPTCLSLTSPGATLKDASRRRSGGLRPSLTAAPPDANAPSGRDEETAPSRRTKKHHWSGAKLFLHSLPDTTPGNFRALPRHRSDCLADRSWPHPATGGDRLVTASGGIAAATRSAKFFMRFFGFGVRLRVARSNWEPTSDEPLWHPRLRAGATRMSDGF